MMRVQFHFINTKTWEPACGAPIEAHATKDVNNAPRCKKCLKIVRDLLATT